ncbi:MAG: DUF4129 domain-containing protein [Halapricum sp.]
MNRNRIIVLVVALLCVGGLALAAATVSTPSSSAPGEGPGNGPGSGPNVGGRSHQKTPDSGGTSLPRPLVILAVIVMAIAFLAALYLFAKAMNLRRLVVLVIAVAIVVVVGFLLLSLLGNPVPLGGGGQPTPTNQSTGGGGNGGSGGRTPTENPTQRTDVPIVLLGAFGLLVLVLVGAIYRYSGSDTDVDVEPVEADDDAASDVQAVGEAAGRAADRIDADTESVENTIYRAWREMTDALDVEQPRTTTPEEFAEVAIDAGMAPDDVRELTWLFEEVRYGEATVTDDRERRASDALRRIQDTYAGGDDE